MFSWLIPFLLLQSAPAAQEKPALPPVEPYLEVPREIRSDVPPFLSWPDVDDLIRGFGYRCEYTYAHFDRERRLKEVWQQTGLNVEFAPGGLRRQQTYIVRKHGPTPSWGLGVPDTAEEIGQAEELKRQILSILKLEPLSWESMNGRNTAVFAFHLPGDKEKAPMTRLYSDTNGRLWFDEEDRILIKVEGRYTKSIKEAWGTRVRRAEGSTWAWRLRRVAGERWVPEEWESWIPSRGFRLKGYFQELYVWGDFVSTSNLIGRTAPPRRDSISRSGGVGLMTSLHSGASC